jgi:hypothetical protein
MIFCGDDNFISDNDYDYDYDSCVYEYEDFYDNSSNFVSLQNEPPCLYLDDSDWEDD